MQLLIFLLTSFAFGQSGARVQSPIWLGIMASDAACTSPGGATANGIYALAGSPVTLRQCINGSASALSSGGGGGGVTVGAALPGTCTVGDLYYLNVSTVGLYGCIATNTWALIGATAANVVEEDTVSDMSAEHRVNTEYETHTCANASAGTTVGRLIVMNGAECQNAAASAANGVIGVLVSGNGTSGRGRYAWHGAVNCDFDATTVVAGHYVQASATAGKCLDAGSTRPTSGQVLGRALAGGAGTNTYAIMLESEEVAASASAGVVKLAEFRFGFNGSLSGSIPNNAGGMYIAASPTGIGYGQYGPVPMFGAYFTHVDTSDVMMSFNLPTTWTGTALSMYLDVMQNDGGTGNVVWGVTTAFLADNDALASPSYNAENKTTVAVSTTTNARIRQSLTISKVGGAGGKMALVKLRRVGTDGADGAGVTPILFSATFEGN